MGARARKVATFRAKRLDSGSRALCGGRLSRDQKSVPEPEEQNAEGESHAADEPTAVWDESALRAAGLGDLLHRRVSDPPNAPATSGPGAANPPSIVVDQSISASPLEPAVPASRVPARRDLGWGSTLLIAIGLGALVYLAIRLFRG